MEKEGDEERERERGGGDSKKIQANETEAFG